MERLREIETMINNQKGFVKELGHHDTKWLIEQAKQVELLMAENAVLQAKWEAQGMMIQKLHKENGKFYKALKEIERWDKMLYSSRELGNFAKKALGLPTIPFKE